MIRKAFPLLLVVTVAGVIGLLGLSLSSVVAQQSGPSRSLPADSVARGETFTVTITDTGFGASGSIGQVVETLPAGFSYVDGSAAKVSGDPNGAVRGKVDATNSSVVRFTLVSVESFAYEVMVGADVEDGEDTFSGAGGDATVTVEGGTTTTPGGLSRSLPADSVARGETFTVTITNTGFGASASIGQVVETLPAGFSYVDGSATRVSGDPNGVVRGTVDATNSSVVRFTLVSVESFTYEVMVGADVEEGEHTFSGDAGQSSVTVGAGTTTPSGLSRSFSADPVSQGETFTVTITGVVADIGQVVETLPAGFSYVDGSATKVVGHAEGLVRATVDATNSSVVRFTLVSVESFAYEVMVGADVQDGGYIFSGDAGQSSVTVGADTTTPPVTRPPSKPSDPGPIGNRSPEFEATVDRERSIAENSPAGTIVVSGLSASDKDGDTIAFGLSGADSDSFAIDDESGRMTVGAQADLDYETKSAYELTVTATDPSGDRATITITISLTNQEEAGTVSLASEQPKVGDSLAAEVSDLDGGVSNTTWLWESSQDMTAWAAISGAESSAYVPTADDADSYLRVTASYDDAEGPGKSAMAMSANAVMGPPRRRLPSPRQRPNPR